MRYFEVSVEVTARWKETLTVRATNEEHAEWVIEAGNMDGIIFNTLPPDTPHEEAAEKYYRITEIKKLVRPHSGQVRIIHQCKK